MPLLDHFRDPLRIEAPWEGFHGQWAGTIAAALNAILPAGYAARLEVRRGTAFRVDVGTRRSRQDGGGTAVRTKAPAWAAADLVVPVEAPTAYAVRVVQLGGQPRLVGAIEIVSESNKKQPHERRRFARKCETMMYAGVGLIVVDVVTTRRSCPPRELLRQILADIPPTMTPGTLTAASYWPRPDEGVGEIEVRWRPLAVGQPLPTLPLAVKGWQAMPVDLEATYEQARAFAKL